jgi:hypothetical protein
MNPVHETMLLDILRDVWIFGAAPIPYYSVYRWFKAERLTKRVWAALNAHWETVREENGDGEGWRLGWIDTGRSDILMFVCLDPEGASKSHLKPVE